MMHDANAKNGNTGFKLSLKIMPMYSIGKLTKRPIIDENNN
jgi:hypothetical protein